MNLSDSNQMIFSFRTNPHRSYTRLLAKQSLRNSLLVQILNHAKHEKMKRKIRTTDLVMETLLFPSPFAPKPYEIK